VKTFRYSRWDGSQGEFGLDAREALDALSELMMEGLDVREALEWMRRHGFELAGLDMRVMGVDELLSELREEIGRLKALEELLRERAHRQGGLGSSDRETAERIRERIRALELLAQELAEGRLEGISSEQLGELLGSDAARSLVLLRDLESTLRGEGLLRGEDPSLTPRAIRQIGAQALARVYADLKKDRPGGHDTDVRGAALPRPDESRPFCFGDPLDIDVVGTLLSAVKRHALASPGRPVPLPIRLGVEDLAVREHDLTTHTTSVLLLDLSWSMSWAGRFPAAKRVALALDHLVRTRFPRDHFFVVGFSTRARQLLPTDLPGVSWDIGDPFTNLQEGLMIAERLISKHPSTSPQVLVITDGQPTAYFDGKALRVEWPGGYGGVSPHAVAETMKQVRRITRRGVTINTFMLDDAPELVGFVERMTQVNRGRAFYTQPSQLGSFLMVDYLAGRRKRRS
jgi:uncharacterized protein with von Willebrand factor type A (vWA) domain